MSNLGSKLQILADGKGKDLSFAVADPASGPDKSQQLVVDGVPVNTSLTETLGWTPTAVYSKEGSSTGNLLVQGQDDGKFSGRVRVFEVDLRSGAIDTKSGRWQKLEAIGTDLETQFGADINQDKVLGTIPPETHRWIEQGQWWRGLSPTVQQSISTWKQPGNLSETILEQVDTWVIAGDNRRKQLSAFIDRNDLAVVGEQSSLFNLPGIASYRLKPDSLSRLRQVQKQADAAGIQLWLEAPLEAELDGPIDEDGITEPAYTGTINVPDGQTTAGSTWHLQTTDLSNANAPLYGINAVSAWSRAGGAGVVVSVNDSVMDIFHPDLQARAFNTNLDLDNDNNNDFIDSDSDGVADRFDSDHVTLPGGDPGYPVNSISGRSESHGTAVSGIILAEHNGQDAVGIAPQAQWIPNAASSPNFDLGTRHLADVINNSWGYWSNSRRMNVATPTDLQRWENAWSATTDHPAISHLVKSAGNGRSRRNSLRWQNTNTRMYNNHREVIGVAATTQAGDVETYSTPGPGVLVSAPVNTATVAGGRTLTSDVSDSAASTTDDRGYTDGNVTGRFDGTSAAAPMVSGTIALMLEANPELTRRDIQHILVRTAQKNRLIDSDLDGELDATLAGGTTELRTSFLASANTDGLASRDPYNTGWFRNAAGHWVSDSFGYGIVDAGAAVDAAATWTGVDPERHVQSGTLHAEEAFTIPQGALGDLDSLTTAGFWQIGTNLKVEWAELSLDLNAPDISELMVVLVSPSGTRSVLLAPGGRSAGAGDPLNFNGSRTVVSNQFWDENANGRWALEVLDVNNNAVNNATIANAQLNLYGTCTHPTPLQVEPLATLREARNPLDEVALAVDLLKRGGLAPDHLADLEVKAIGSDQAWGRFSDGAAGGLLVDEGLILTSGLATDAIGPNQAENTTTDHNNRGHWLLDRQIEQTTRDAAGLELRFTPSKDITLQWRYQFGSEEFDEWSGSQFNDVSGIFLADVSKTPELALSGKPIPNVVNLTESGGLGSLSVNELESFGSIGKTRFHNPICGPMGWEYDGGSLEPQRTRKVDLLAGRTYYLSALIGDASDGLFDSGLLIGAANEPEKESKTDASLRINQGRSGRFRNGSGFAESDGSIAFSFKSPDPRRDVQVSLKAFDIDAPQEVAVAINGEALGHLEPTGNNRQRKRRVLIPAEHLQDEGNILQFSSADPSERWGVSKVRLTSEPPSVQFRAPGQTDDQPLLWKKRPLTLDREKTWSSLDVSIQDDSRFGQILVQRSAGKKTTSQHRVFDFKLSNGVIKRRSGRWLSNQQAEPSTELRFGKDLNRDRVLGSPDPRVERALDQRAWWTALTPAVQHSIRYWEQPQNLSKTLSSALESWTLAGPNPKGRLQRFIRKNNLKASADLSPTFNLTGIDVFELAPGGRSAFKALQKQATAKGYKLWMNVNPEEKGAAALDPASITEPAFVGTVSQGSATAASTWHLEASDLTNPAALRYGLDVRSAWAHAGGEGVTVAVKDSAQDIFHPDLVGALFDQAIDLDGSGNYFADSDGDGAADAFDSEAVTLGAGDPGFPVNTLGVNGSSAAAQSHGTPVAGIIHAQHNGQDAVGIAPQAAYIPDGSFGTTFDLATRELGQIINNSWGRSLRTISIPSPNALQSWQNAWNVVPSHPVAAIMVKSAGNNRGFWQNTNNSAWDPYRQLINVAATRRDGDIETYSTPGPAVVVAAPVNTGAAATGRTFTTDVSDTAGDNSDNRGYIDGNTTPRFAGTSSAAPMVSGVIALMKEVNPSLTVRDAQHILAETAQKNRLVDSDGDGDLDAVVPGGTTELRTGFSTTADTNRDGNADPYSTGWFENGAGYWVSDSFGFGIVDAEAAVQLADGWSPVHPELRYQSDPILTGTATTLPQGTLGGLNSLSPIGSWAVPSNLKVEWVEVTADLNVADLTETMVVLVSPSGTRSVLLAPGGGLSNSASDTLSFNGERTLISNQFWGESSLGLWSLEVLDVNTNSVTQTISDARLDIHGTCLDLSPLKVDTYGELSASTSPVNGQQLLALQLLAEGGVAPTQIDSLEVRPVGAESAWGRFSNGSDSSLTVDQGLIITSGKARDAIGPNDREDTSTDQGTPGHWLLDDQIPQATQDASGLEVLFTPNEDVLVQWGYQFGSDEFQEYAGTQYNDAAGLFIADVSKNPKVALGGEPFSGVVNLTANGGMDALSVNEVESFGSVDKTRFANPVCGTMGWEYDGGSLEPSLTPELTLRAGRTYYLSALTADASDGIYDSGLIVGAPMV